MGGGGCSALIAAVFSTTSCCCPMEEQRLWQLCTTRPTETKNKGQSPADGSSECDRRWEGCRAEIYTTPLGFQYRLTKSVEAIRMFGRSCNLLELRTWQVRKEFPVEYTREEIGRKVC